MRENTFIDREVTISLRKLLRNDKTYHRWVQRTQISQKKLTGGSKTSEFVKVFSLNSFLAMSSSHVALISALDVLVRKMLSNYIVHGIHVYQLYDV